MTSVSGELVIRHETVPAGYLNAAPFVTLHDTVPNDEQPDAQQMHAVAGEPGNLTVVDDNGIFFGAIFLGIVEEDAVNWFLCVSSPL